MSLFLYHRTFLPENHYSAPVEIDVYGNKVAFISYGDTQMATIIDSPPIAESLRQLCQLLIDAYKPSSDKKINELLNVKLYNKILLTYLILSCII